MALGFLRRERSREGGGLPGLLEAWKLSRDLHGFRPSASPETVAAAETAFGRRFPAGLRSLYLVSNGFRLFDGNLEIHPLVGIDGRLGLLMPNGRSLTQQLREWEWSMPDELVVFAGDGRDSVFGLWLPDARREERPTPVIEAKLDALGVVGTDLLPFLRYQTAFLLLAFKAKAAPQALAALGAPASFAKREADDRTLAALQKWADPNLPGLQLGSPVRVAVTPVGVEWLRRTYGADS